MNKLNTVVAIVILMVGIAIGVFIGGFDRKAESRGPTHIVPEGQTMWVYNEKLISLSQGHLMIVRLSREDWQKMVDTMRTKERVIGEAESKQSLEAYR